MKETWTTKEVNELLDECFDNLTQFYSFGDTLNDFKKEKGLIPSLEVGKWYKHKGNTFSEETSMFCLTKICDRGNCYGYGFNESGEWFSILSNNGETCASNNVSKKYLVEATNEEVEQALIKEAKKRGYDSKQSKCLEGTDRRLNFKSFTYTEDGALLVDMVDFPYYNTIFKDGKWSEIVETIPEYTMDEAIEKMGHEFKIKK